MSQLEHQDRIDQLLAEIQSILLATVHRDGSPLASYTPYAVDSDRAGFWILVSDLAGHAQNLDRTQQCSVLVIRDEQDAAQIYVRERLQFEMRAVEVIRGDARWDRGIAGLRDRHGRLVDTLITLSDFRLFHLLPQSGRYIVGFGQAYELKPGSLTTIDHHLQGPTGPQNDSAG